MQEAEKPVEDKQKYNLPEQQGVNLAINPTATNPNLHPEYVNFFSNLVDIASKSTVGKAVTASLVGTEGTGPVRNNFAVANQNAQISANAKAAEDAGRVGNVEKAVKHVEAAAKAATTLDEGALEKQVVRNVVKNPQKIPAGKEGILQARQEKNLIMSNSLKEAEQNYEDLGGWSKAQELASTIFPLSFNMAASAAGPENSLRDFSDIIDVGGFIRDQAARFNNMPLDEFKTEWPKFLNSLKNKSKGVFGGQGFSTQGEVISALMNSTGNDATLYNVMTVLDIAPTGIAAAKAVGKGVKAVGKTVLKTEQVGRAIQDTTVSTGSVMDVAKNLHQQEDVAVQVSKSFEDGAPNVMVDTPAAGAKNAAPFQEPMFTKDSVSTRVQNQSAFYDGVGKRLEEYQDDPHVAFIAEKLRQVQANRGLSPAELDLAEKRMVQDLANDNTNFNIVAEHDINPSTLEPIVKARIGQSDGEGWSTLEQAKEASKMFKGGDKFSYAQDVTGKYYLQAERGLDDLATITGFEVKEPGFMGNIIQSIFLGPFKKPLQSLTDLVRNPLGDIPKEIHTQAVSAVAYDKQLMAAKLSIQKRAIDKLNFAEQNGILKVAQHWREKESYNWPTENELADSFRTITGKDPTLRQVEAWNDYKLINDIDYTMSNLDKRTKVVAAGYRTLNIPSKNMELQNTLSRPVDSYSKLQYPKVYDAEAQTWRFIDTEEDFNQYLAQGYKVFELGDSVKVKGVDDVMENVDYVISKNAQESDVPFAVLPYRANGRVDYAGEHFAKQPNVGTVVRNGKETKINRAPITHAIGDSRLAMERFVTNTNAAISKLKHYRSLIDQGKQVSDVLQRDLAEAWAKTRWQTADNFMRDVKEGHATLEPLEALGNRQKLRMGKKHATQSSGTLNAERQQEELQMLFMNARRGERKLDPNGQPAELKSPFQTMDQSFSKDVKKLTFQNFVNDASEKFVKTFGEDLREPYANPVNAIVHGVFNESATDVRKAVGHRYQMWLRNMARVGFTQDSKEFDELAKVALKYETALEKSESGLTTAMIKAQYGLHKSWMTAEPLTFFRHAMFHARFGLYNTGQIMTQGMQLFVTMGAAFVENPIRATRAVKDAFLLSAGLTRGVQKDFAFLDKMAKKLDPEASSAAQMAKDWADAGTGHLLHNSGQVETQVLSRPALLEKFSAPIAKAKQIGGSLLESGTMFYRGGTTIGNLGMFAFNRIRLLEKYGPRALEDGSKVRRDYLKELAFETERKTFGQSSANNLTIQYASQEYKSWGTMIELTTQYSQYGLKYLSAMLPKALGGSSAYSAKEKIALAISGSVLGGSAFLPFGNYISSQLFLQAKKEGWFDGTADDWKNNIWEQGLLDAFVKGVFGVDSQLSQQVSPWSAIEGFGKLIQGDDSLSNYAGGPLLNMMSSVVEKYTQATSLQEAIEGKNYNFMSPESLAYAMEALAGVVSSVGRFQKLIDAMKSPNIVSKKSGLSVARSSDTAAWLNLIGVNTGPYDILNFQREILDTFSANEKQYQNMYRNLMVKRFEYLNAGDYENAQKVTDAMAHTLSWLPPQQRKRVVRGAIKNWNTPVMEYNRQKIIQSLSNLDLMQGD